MSKLTVRLEKRLQEKDNEQNCHRDFAQTGPSAPNDFNTEDCKPNEERHENGVFDKAHRENRNHREQCEK